MVKINFHLWWHMCLCPADSEKDGHCMLYNCSFWVYGFLIADGQSLMLDQIEKDLPPSSVQVLTDSKWTFITQQVTYSQLSHWFSFVQFLVLYLRCCVIDIYVKYSGYDRKPWWTSKWYSLLHYLYVKSIWFML